MNRQTSNSFFTRYCPNCEGERVHESFISATTDQRRIIAIIRCMGCRRVSGRIV